MLLQLLIHVLAPPLARAQPRNIITGGNLSNNKVVPTELVGDGVGYRVNPAFETDCRDVDSVLVDAGYTFSMGTCKDKGCDCVFKTSKCNERPEGGAPYATGCPASCRLLTPSTDTVGDRCIDTVTNRVGTWFIQCLPGEATFERTDQCYVVDTESPSGALTGDQTGDQPGAQTGALSRAPSRAPSPALNRPAIKPSIDFLNRLGATCGSKTGDEDGKAEYDEEMFTFLSIYSAAEDLENRHSPQYASMEWLKYYSLCPDSDGVVELYVLGVMYFGWGLGDLLYRLLPEKGIPDLCGWNEITCGTRGITRVRLVDKPLVGTIPHEIGFLTRLTYLDLSKNSLYSTIPQTIGNLHSLEHLNLAQNSLTGKLPGDIYSLRDLNFLALDHNVFVDILSDKVAALFKLQTLSLSSNSFHGIVPFQLGRLEYLKELYLDDNNFTGRCGDDLCNNKNFGELIYLFVDCEVDCPCATYSSSENVPCNQQQPILINDNNHHQPIPVDSNYQQPPMVDGQNMNQSNNNWPQQVNSSPNISQQNSNWGQPLPIDSNFQQPHMVVGSNMNQSNNNWSLSQPVNPDSNISQQNNNWGQPQHPIMINDNNQQQLTLIDSNYQQPSTAAGPNMNQPNNNRSPQNQIYNTRSDNDRWGDAYRWKCLCDSYTKRPCTYPSGVVPGTCGSGYYPCSACGGGGIRGSCVCDYYTGAPCVVRRYPKYPKCELRSYYECSAC